MFRMSSEEEYEAMAEGGTRHLFVLGPFEFHDTMDEEGGFHHFVLESAAADGEPGIYETDRPAMYEFMARYLAGEYEKVEYDLERSPAHEALLDLLEMAAARARSGETDFTVDELEGGGYEGEVEEDER